MAFKLRSFGRIATVPLGAAITTLYLKTNDKTGDQNENLAYLDKGKGAENVIDEPDEPKLVNAQIIFRHAARTPVYLKQVSTRMMDVDWNLCSKVNRPPHLETMDKHLLEDVHFVPLHVTDLTRTKPRPHSLIDERQGSVFMPGMICRSGQLTDVGALQASALGRKLRSRYEKLLNLEEAEIRTRSSNVARCLSTLSIVLGSFLPHARRTVPVETTTEDAKKEYVYPNVEYCHKLKMLMRQGKSRWISSPTQEVISLRDELSAKLTSEEIEHLGLLRYDFIPLNDWCMIFDAHEIKNPWNFTESERSRLSSMASQQVAHYLNFEFPNDRETLSVAIGKMLEEILGNVHKPEAGVLHFISAHDTTILPLLIALNIFDKEWPTYCSHIIIETWQQMTGKMVRILYNGEQKFTCSINEFQAIVESSIPATTWDEECGEEGQFIISGNADSSVF